VWQSALVVIPFTVNRMKGGIAPGVIAQRRRDSSARSVPRNDGGLFSGKPEAANKYLPRPFGWHGLSNTV
jgi:hypothetical protein